MMALPVAIKHAVLRFMPEAILRHLRRSHFAAKLTRATPEPDMALLPYLVPAGGCALDIGANFGLYSRFLAEAVGPTGRVRAVEPIPATFDVLRSNIDRLGLRQVMPHNFAASDEAGSVTMAVPEYVTGGDNFYEARVVHVAVPNHVRSVTVPAYRLDDRFVTLARIDFIKCDVEGHEGAVLAGAPEILKRHHPAWLIEVSGNPDDPTSAAAGVVQTLRTHGYDMFRLDSGRLRLRRTGDRSVNYFFLRPEHLARVPAEMRS